MFADSLKLSSMLCNSTVAAKEVTVVSQEKIDPFSKDSVKRALKSWHYLEELGEHPLARIRIVEEKHRKLRRSDILANRGRSLRSILHDAIEELRVGSGDPDYSDRRWRPYIILTEEYIAEKTSDYLSKQFKQPDGFGIAPRTYQVARVVGIEKIAGKLRQWEDEARDISTTKARDERDSFLTDEPYTFTTLIERKTRGFVGRRFVFDALKTFLEKKDRGYFIVQGEPGIGKTALAAQLVKDRGYIHHFNDATLGIVKAEQFLQNVGAQLIARYQLDHLHRPPRARQDGAYLVRLLEEASARLDESKPAVIIVDALDEADLPSDPRANVLHLPPYLPKGVYFVGTRRLVADLPLQVEVPEQNFYLEANSKGNRQDVRNYLNQEAHREGIQARRKAERMDVKDFVEVLLEKSEGNFMYLYYVIPEIEAGKYPGLKVDDLPQGLMGYYERHWRQMRTMDEDQWIKYRQPIICFLAAAREPISVEQLASFSRLPVDRVRAALRDWREFLVPESIGEQKRYRIYHTSFQDFLREKDEVGEIELIATHSDIADVLLEQWQSEKDE